MEDQGAAQQQLADLHELARCSGLEISPQMLTVVLELLRLDVTPQGVVAFLRTIKNAKINQVWAQ
jgi:hypothetical protein